MKELNLHEEIIKSLKLISYDRSLTLNEQNLFLEDWAEDLLGGPVKQAPKINFQKIKKEQEKLFDIKSVGSFNLDINKTKKRLNILLNKKILKYDGTVGADTINAVKTLQKKYGLPTTGKINYQTLKVFDKKFDEIKKSWKSKRYQKEVEFEKKITKRNKISKYTCKKRLKTKSSDPNENVAKKVFLELEDEIGYHWYDVSAWTTSKSDILNALKLIKNKETYLKVLELVDLCYPESRGLTLIEFIQSEEFSPGQVDLEKRAMDALKNKYTYSTPILGVSGAAASEIPAITSWYMNDAHLKSYQQILQKFNKNEKYYQENPYLEKNIISRVWKTKMPPYAREVFHNATMIASLALAVFSGGALTPLLISFGIDLVDAAAFMAEGDPYMAGLCLVFSLVPFGEIGKTQIKKSIQWYKELSSLTPAARKKAVANSPYKQLFDEALRTRNIIKAYRRLFGMKLSKFVREVSSIGVVAKLLVRLFRSGIITIKFLTKLGLMVGGVFVSWHFIAQKLGILPTETPYEKLAKSRIQKALEGDTKNFVVGYLDQYNAKYPNEFFDVKNNSSHFRLIVLLIQYCLKAGGYDVTNTERVEMTPNWEKKTPQGQVNFNYNPKYDYLYKQSGSAELQIKRTNWQKSKSLPLTKNFTKVKLPFKWGYFDENMEKMVKSYQKSHNLPSTGVIGSKTIMSLLSDLKSGKMNSIKNYTSHKLTNQEEQDLFNLDVKKELEKKELEKKELENIEIKKLEEAFINQKNKLSEDIEKMSENEEGMNELSVEEFNEILKMLENYDKENKNKKN